MGQEFEFSYESNGHDVSVTYHSDQFYGRPVLRIISPDYFRSTLRQLQILSLATQSCSNRQTAEILGISLQTVKNTLRIFYETNRGYFSPPFYPNCSSMAARAEVLGLLKPEGLIGLSLLSTTFKVT